MVEQRRLLDERNGDRHIFPGAMASTDYSIDPYRNKKLITDGMMKEYQASDDAIGLLKIR